MTAMEGPIDVLVHNARIVSHDTTIDGALGIRDGKVAFVTTSKDLPHAGKTIDAEARYVIPGVIDPHTHPGGNQPFVDDIRTETRAAAVGGVTTWFATIKSTRMGRVSRAMTEPEDAISYLEACKEAIDIVESESLIDIGFTLAIMSDRDASEIPEIAERFGVTTYKFYAGYRNANEFARRIGLPVPWDDGTLYLGFENIARVGGMGLVHCENNDVTRVLTERIRATGREDLAAWEDRAPDYAEAFHVSQFAHFALITGCTLYIPHTSSGMGLEESSIWRARGADVVNETCPHYIILTKFDDPPGKAAKVNAPIRLKSDNEALWRGLASGTVECMGSDHVPGKRAEQVDLSLWECITGMAGTEQLLPLLLSEGVNAGRISMEKLVEVTSYNSARRFGVYPRKGTLQPGSDADLVIVDLNREETISIDNPVTWHSASDFAIWEGRRVKGYPVLTMLRGRVIAEDGQVTADGGGGYLRRTPAHREPATVGRYPRTV